MRIERRLRQPWWLTVVVPVASLAVAFLLSAVMLLVTGHPPIHSFHRLFDAAFIAHGALSDTVVAATPPADLGRRPMMELTSGYVSRAEAILPGQGDRQPWRVPQHYVKDLVSMRFGRIDEDLNFEARSAT